jgi:hypothetical protein
MHVKCATAAPQHIRKTFTIIGEKRLDQWTRPPPVNHFSASRLSNFKSDRVKSAPSATFQRLSSQRSDDFGSGACQNRPVISTPDQEAKLAAVLRWFFFTFVRSSTWMRIEFVACSRIRERYFYSNGKFQSDSGRKSSVMRSEWRLLYRGWTMEVLSTGEIWQLKGKRSRLAAFLPCQCNIWRRKRRIT